MILEGSAPTAQRWLVAGLGNPGEEYVATRHNAGFRVAEAFAERVGASYWKSECGAACAHKPWHGVDLIIAKPQSFMNLSGVPLAQVVKKYDVAVDHLIVIHDDLDIPAGAIRVKCGGGHGGHNGLRSIFDKLGTRDFLRVRIGIGRPPGRMDAADFVLKAPRGEDLEAFDHALARGAEAVPSLIENGLVKTQSAFN